VILSLEARKQGFLRCIGDPAGHTARRRGTRRLPRRSLSGAAWGGSRAGLDHRHLDRRHQRSADHGQQAV